MTEEKEIKIDHYYENYLKSPEWQKKRAERLTIDEGICQMCGTTGTPFNPLCVHHLDYYQKGNEDVYKKLVTLCWCCHNAVHRMMSRVTDENGTRGWLKSLPSSNHVYLVNQAITNNADFNKYKKNPNKFITEEDFIESQRRIYDNGKL